MTYEEEIAAMDFTAIMREFDHVEKDFDWYAEEEHRALIQAAANESAKMASRERLDALYAEIDSRGYDFS